MAENRMELFIETLTGTAFELSCSPFETIASIKAKIQYSEGIPVSQQHLIWKSQELNDDLCLQDYQITDGATLKLVLGMRGGPINTRQLSDTKKLKDIADYVEKRSETSGSGGRPFTVLVFHDGDKVHMYTLMERGECTVSPISGTISESSSLASLKNVEELDQDLIRENEITREKMTQLQEQIRALNINRSKRIPVPVTKENISPSKSSNKIVEDFHLPPLETFEPQEKSYLHKNENKKINKHYFSRFISDSNAKQSNEKLDDINGKIVYSKDMLSRRESEDSVSNKIPLKLSTSLSRIPPNTVNHSCSNFLPYIESFPEKRPFKNVNSTNAQYIGLNLSTSCLNPVIKHDISKMKYRNDQCPLTSSQAISSKRYMDLDQWLQNRPRTTPESTLSKSIIEEESLCKNKLIRDNRTKNKIKKSLKSPLSISLTSGEKSSLMMETCTNHRDISYNIPSPFPCKNKSNFVHSHSKTDVETFLTASLKALKAYSPHEVQENVSKHKNSSSSPKSNDNTSRPDSGRKLPFIKAKKKSYKRCSLCSKRTGLATSYTCRCGKNFCAPHRYAEVHQCSYDYKTEGRRMLQLNNPVVAASKLPKI